MHNGLIRDYPRIRRELLLTVDDSLFGSIEGTTDSEAMFSLALTLGLESDPIGAVEGIVGLVEETGRRHGIDDPVQMTIATTDGGSIDAFRYSSEGASRSLYSSTRADTLKLLHPEDADAAASSDGARVVVSEPLGDLEGAWHEVPERTSASSRRATTSSGRSRPAGRGTRVDQPGIGTPRMSSSSSSSTDRTICMRMRRSRRFHSSASTASQTTLSLCSHSGQQRSIATRLPSGCRSIATG